MRSHEWMGQEPGLPERNGTAHSSRRRRSNSRKRRPKGKKKQTNKTKQQQQNRRQLPRGRSTTGRPINWNPTTSVEKNEKKNELEIKKTKNNNTIKSHLLGADRSRSYFFLFLFCQFLFVDFEKKAKKTNRRSMSSVTRLVFSRIPKNFFFFCLAFPFEKKTKK